jgi:hypothetical protein
LIFNFTPPLSRKYAVIGSRAVLRKLWFSTMWVQVPLLVQYISSMYKLIRD